MSNILRPLRAVHFRRFWLANTISVFGDHLTFVALPWLVLKLTGDALAMGTVMAVAAVPRAVFMLFGGALSDRWSPRTVLLWSTLFRLVMMALLSVSVATELISLPGVVAIAFCFGLADAFHFPAASAMPPRLLKTESLAGGNALLQGSMQVSLVVGPMIGGMLLAALGSPGIEDGALTDRFALSTVFAVVTGAFACSHLLLTLVSERFPPLPDGSGSLLDSILDALRWAWADSHIRTFLLIMAGVSLVFRGPFMVGVPALSDGYLAEGAVAFGVIVSCLGVGSIIGAVVAGSFRPLAYHWVGKLLLVDFALFGSVMLVMAQVHDLILIGSLVLVAGILDGYVIVFLTTWLQRYVPPARLGRVMSLVMFVSQGLFPVSAAAAGAMAGWDLLMMLTIGGALAVTVSLSSLLVRRVRRLGFD